MKILMVVHRVFPTPNQKALYEWARILHEVGHQVHIVTPEMVGEISHIPCPVMASGGENTARILGRLRYYWRVRRIALEGNYEVVHTVGVWGSVLVTVGLAKRRISTIYDLRSGPERNGFVPFLKRRIHAFQSGFFSKRICVAGDLGRQLFGDHEYTVIPLGVRLLSFREVARQYGAKRLVYCGNLNRSRQVDVVIQAFSRLARKHPDASLTIIGQGDHKRELEEMVASMSLENRVEFLDYVHPDRIPERLTLYSIGIDHRPSRGFLGVQPSLKILEYAAAGLAVLAVDNPINRCLLETLRGGILYAETPDGLCQAMDRLMGDEALVRELGTIGRENVGAFDWDAMPRRGLLGVYDTIPAALRPTAGSGPTDPP